MLHFADEAVPYWQAFSHNTLLTNPTHPIVHAVGDAHDGAFPAVGIAYFYPEQHVECECSHSMIALRSHQQQNAESHNCINSHTHLD